MTCRTLGDRFVTPFEVPSASSGVQVSVSDVLLPTSCGPAVFPWTESTRVEVRTVDKEEIYLSCSEVDVT